MWSTIKVSGYCHWMLYFQTRLFEIAELLRLSGYNVAFSPQTKDIFNLFSLTPYTADIPHRQWFIDDLIYPSPWRRPSISISPADGWILLSRSARSGHRQMNIHKLLNPYTLLYSIDSFNMILFLRDASVSLRLRRRPRSTFRRRAVDPLQF